MIGMFMDYGSPRLWKVAWSSDLIQEQMRKRVGVGVLDNSQFREI